MAQLWTAIGLVCMTLGAIFFGVKAASAKLERWRTLLTLNFFICAIASVLYLVMLTGQGEGVFGDHNSYWVRYVTWMLSTPLLLLDLTFLGRSSRSTTGALLGANALMLATGFLADVYPNSNNMTWYIVSCGAYLGVVYLLLVPYRTEAELSHPGKVGQQAFQKVLTVHIALWSLYPVVWILADTGFNIISDGVEAMFYSILDIAAKVGFGLLSMNTLSKIEKYDVWQERETRISPPNAPSGDVVMPSEGSLSN